MKNFFFPKNKKRGISLLLTIIIMTIILALGLGLSAILIRGTRIIKFSEDAVIAFYAADAGAEEGLNKKNNPCHIPDDIPLKCFDPPYNNICYEVRNYLTTNPTSPCIIGAPVICSCSQSKGSYHEKIRLLENDFEGFLP